MISDKRRAVRYEQERKLREIRRETGQSPERDMFQDMIYYSFWEKEPAGMDKERLDLYKKRYFDHCEKLANEQARKLGYPIKFQEVEDKSSKRGARKSRQKKMSVVEGEEIGDAEAADGEVAENGADAMLLRRLTLTPWRNNLLALRCLFSMIRGWSFFPFSTRGSS